MSVRSSYQRYGSVAIALHWLIALLILLNIAVGFWFNEIMNRHDGARFAVVQFHKSIGLTVLVLSVARLVWRLMNPVPRLPADLAPPMKALARVTHYALYILMIVVPLLGWMVVSASRTGIPTMYFGKILWPNLAFIADLPRDQKIADGQLYASGHLVAAYLLLALVIGHAIAAIYHHVALKDGVLVRMLPGTGGVRSNEPTMDQAT
jgi:cytochrome b561